MGESISGRIIGAREILNIEIIVGKEFLPKGLVLWQALLPNKVFEHTVVTVDNKEHTKQVTVLLIQYIDNYRDFFFVYWIVLFCTIKLHRLKSNEMCSFLNGAKQQNRPYAKVTHITDDKDLVLTRKIIIDNSQTLSACHKHFNSIEGHLVVNWPARSGMFSILCCEWYQYLCELGEPKK